MPNRFVQIAVEGNVGSGKTTFLRYFESLSPNVEVFPEPIDQWNNVKGFRLFTSKIRLVERSIYSNRYVFTEVNRRNGVLTDGDCEILNEYYEWSCQLPIFKLDLIVYLRSTPEVCVKRIRRRQRTGEDTMSIEFLREVHRLHEEWLLGKYSEYCPAPVVIFDTSGSLDNVTSTYFKRKDEILCTVLV
ncbi:Deoxynucleoside kinase [Echinococcus granulosus]|uniref:Deoxynucleoside kinase n=1 Tax=Echinococcus granulosus TaxID=6210 RepID=W6U9Z5_ECHGR|nr:Deoxynucleoside kinase [Echinococcus granulosus]EUB55297.1 Deoxynucleoside kinase [Echinococcus granulosus]